MGQSERSDGTQAVTRAISLLKAIARADAAQMSLSRIARAEGLPRATAYRLLQALVEAGMVERSADGKHYALGELTDELGRVPTRHAQGLKQWRGLIERVALRTGATTYLMRRSGLDAVCLLRAEGSGPLRVVPVEVGERRCLGLGAGSIALLAELDAAELEQVARVLSQQRAGLGLVPGLSGLREAVAEVRASGFAVSQSKVANGAFGMGCVIPDASGPSRHAISLAAHQSIVDRIRIDEWQHCLHEEIARFAAQS